VIATSEQTVVLAGHGERRGTWATFSAGSTVAWSYAAEKLQLREGDRPGWSKLFSAVLGQRWYDPQTGEEDE
jgi:hypothetical protein